MLQGKLVKSVTLYPAEINMLLNYHCYCWTSLGYFAGNQFSSSEASWITSVTDLDGSPVCVWVTSWVDCYESCVAWFFLSHKAVRVLE